MKKVRGTSEMSKGKCFAQVSTETETKFTPKASGSRISVFSTMLLPDCPPNVNSLALILLYTLAECRII